MEPMSVKTIASHPSSLATILIHQSVVITVATAAVHEKRNMNVERCRFSGDKGCRRTRTYSQVQTAMIGVVNKSEKNSACIRAKPPNFYSTTAGSFIEIRLSTESLDYTTAGSLIQSTSTHLGGCFLRKAVSFSRSVLNVMPFRLAILSQTSAS